MHDFMYNLKYQKIVKVQFFTNDFIRNYIHLKRKCEILLLGMMY